jgi:hypothetical protein
MWNDLAFQLVPIRFGLMTLSLGEVLSLSFQAVYEQIEVVLSILHIFVVFDSFLECFLPE